MIRTLPPPVYTPRFLTPPVFETRFPELPPNARVLIVDDEPVNVALLEDLLASVGGAPTLCALTDPRLALDRFRTFCPDLILLDLRMPYLDGFGVMELLGREIPVGVFLPILVLTADVSLNIRQRALAVGATDFLAKPFDNLEAVLRIRNLLTARMQYLQLQGHNAHLEAAVATRTAELRDSQELLVRQERLSALGTMAAGVAHDFNNALTLISGYGDLALAQIRGTENTLPATAMITALLGATRNATDTVGRLRDFARPAAPDAPHLPVDLNALAREAVAATRPRWSARQPPVEVCLELPPDLPGLLGAAGELRDATTNLVFNAVDAMPAGGTVTVRTAAPPGAGCVLLEVTDNGVGMDAETSRRCLEPFFTTKGDGGTGLGLAMVYGAVQRHGGTVEIVSAPGRGTTIRLRLPTTP